MYNVVSIHLDYCVFWYLKYGTRRREVERRECCKRDELRGLNLKFLML